ncbi:hypothetical protein PENTCL1PPCAC_24454 [Pristionchus entomophagus]|uniref:Uncharacterized protein n=1 Tax=Pristionchus entomophagus TaxID=358040 RepID=A0AAV5U7W4_9BILA|nr:hypothetical protein PENTCL1PPCAC_24454 [Pristionchus entomophagus]
MLRTAQLPSLLHMHTWQPRQLTTKESCHSNYDNGNNKSPQLFCKSFLSTLHSLSRSSLSSGRIKPPLDSLIRLYSLTCSSQVASRLLNTGGFSNFVCMGPLRMEVLGIKNYHDFFIATLTSRGLMYYRFSLSLIRFISILWKSTQPIEANESNDATKKRRRTSAVMNFMACEVTREQSK